MLEDNSSQWDSHGQRSKRAGRRIGTRTLIAVALVGALVGGAVDRYAGGFGQPTVLPTLASVPRIGAVAAPDAPSATTSAPSDPTSQAIAQVIQRGDEEQVQAVATKDLTVMADTSTSAFYQQQAQATQDLLDNGITAIKLVGIEWGPISVTGTSATAEATETWSTTYADGTSEQARDRNVYTLVSEGGSWKVQADDHPDQAPAAGASGSAAPSPGRRPAPQPSTPGVSGSRDTSSNWSGYAATGGSYTGVSGTWSVPQFAPTSPAGADATWVGIGGVTSHDLIQAGTQETVSGSGQTQYQAWVETLPQASHPVPLTVRPGDVVTVAISQQGPDQWLIAFTNGTTGQTLQVTEHYASTQSSAEWVEEAPSAMRGRLLPLDDFGTVSFSGASAVKDGQSVTVAEAGGQAITMITRSGQALAEPSPLGADGASFNVARTATPSPSQAVPSRRGQGGPSPFGF